MTVRELIERLQALPEADRHIPVLVEGRRLRGLFDVVVVTIDKTSPAGRVLCSCRALLVRKG